jgi:uncharacterized protein YejL (UPF0352 family)
LALELALALVKAQVPELVKELVLVLEKAQVPELELLLLS